VRVGNLADLGAEAGMPSLPSLQRFIAARDDFPLIARGGYGKHFVIDLDAAVAFVRANWRDGRTLAVRQRQHSQQQVLPFLEIEP